MGTSFLFSHTIGERSIGKQDMENKTLRKRDTAQIKKTAARYARPLALKYSFYTRITV